MGCMYSRELAHGRYVLLMNKQPVDGMYSGGVSS